MFRNVDWTEAGDHIRARGRITTMQADEALNDPERVVIDPDYNSKSGRSVRIIGYSESASALLTVIVIDDNGYAYGVNGWHANAKDHRIYQEGETR